MITLVDRLHQLPAVTQPCNLTIGTFDGVHLGHQAVLQYLLKISTGAHQPHIAAAFTFTNHPSEILRPERSAPLLTAPTFRYRLLERFSLQRVFAIGFTPELAQLSAEEFLGQLRQRIPFAHLVLGHDATIGKGKEGRREIVEALARKMGFGITYLPPFHVHGVPISSSLIRDAVRQGKLNDAKSWLGRPYSLTGYIVPGHGRGRKLGFPTLNIDVRRLCLPPFGVYAVEFRAHQETHEGIANLGLAPTIRMDRPPTLEVHLFDHPGRTTTGLVEVVLHSFIRPERKFATLEELRHQIAIDVAAVRCAH